MKRYILPVLVLLIIVAGCKKENTLTPDGKPKTDAADNTLRVDINSAASYNLSLTVVNVTGGDHVTDFSKNNMTGAYEYVTKTPVGQRISLSVYANTFGSLLSCDLYYKGAKVQPADMTIEKVDGQPGVQAHIQLNYLIGHKGP